MSSFSARKEYNLQEELNDKMIWFVDLLWTVKI